MNKELQKALYKQIEMLQDHQTTLFEQGHSFWHCDAVSVEHNKPFYYYQINRSTHMSTCSTCYKLMELRKEIRKIQRLLNIPQTPLYTNYRDNNITKHISVSNKSDFNPNYAYMS